MRRGFGFGRQRAKRGPFAPGLTPVDVIQLWGESNDVGARDSLTTLPNGYYATDNNVFVWDDADLLGAGQAARVLKAPSWSTVTVTIATPGVVTWTGHTLANGDPVSFTTTGALPTGITAGTRYYVVNQAANTFQIAATRGGAAIATSGTQSGVHTAAANGGHEQQPGGAAYLDTAYMATVGKAYAIAKRYRARNPSKELYFFFSAQGGGRFSDLASRGRAANYNPALGDGAFNEGKVSWNAFVSWLATQGKQPNTLGLDLNLGANSAADATETSNFQSDVTGLISALRSNGIIGANTKVLVDRLGNQLTDTNGTNRPNIRAAQLAVAAADPTKVEVLDTDGVTVVGVPDNIHWTAQGHALAGQRVDAQIAGLWHPAKPIQAAGDLIYPVRQWQPGEANASTAQMLDLVNNGRTFTHPTAPVLNTRSLASGLIARYATWNGSSSYSLSGNEGAINRAGGFILYGAINMAAVNNAVVYSEAHDTLANQFWGLKSDAAGNACITIRDDNGVLALSLASLGAVLFDGTWKTFVLTFDGSTFTIYVNGVAGSSPQTITKGPMTLQNSTIASQKVGGSVAGFAPLNAGEIGIMQYSTTGLAGIVANLHAYLSREWLA